jgi:PAS domain S-box-containing protein
MAAVVSLDILIQPIWELSPYSIAVIDFGRDPQRRRFVYVNAAFSELTGYSRAETLGCAATLLNGPKTGEVATDACETALAQGQPYRAAVVHYRKDGSEYVAQATVAPLVEPDGGAEFLILVETIMPSPNPAAMHNHDSMVPLALRMPLQEFPAGELPRHLVSHPELDALQVLWTKLRGDRKLPQRIDFDLRTVSRWAPHLSVAVAMPTGRFLFRLFGTELARVYGQDLTGRYLDELTPRDFWSVIIRHYQDVLRTARPLFAPLSISNGQWYNEVSRLVLPLATAATCDAVACVMAADYPRSIH